MRASLAVAVITLAACSDPRFDVEITYRQPLGDENTAMELLRVQVSVIDAVAAAEAPDDEVDGTAGCLDVALGRIDQAVLDGARRASASGEDGTALTGVPRLGDKLVIVEVRTPAGRRFGAGCTAIGDIDDDEVVPVEVKVAPVVQVFAREETTDIVAVKLLAVTPWNPLQVVTGHQVLTELHTSGERYEAAPGAIGDDGGYDTPVLPPAGAPLSAGPAQTVVRVEWAEAVIRLPAFVPWQAIESLETSPGQRPRLGVGPDATPGYARNWTMPLPGTMFEGRYIVAAGVSQPTVGGERIVVVRYDPAAAARTLELVAAPAPGVRAVAFFPGEGLVTVIDDLWLRLAPATGSLVPLATAEGVGPASQVLAIGACGAQVGGLLVRRDAYRAYLAPGELASTRADGAGLHALAQELGAGEVVVGSDCLTLDDGSATGRQVQVVLSRGGGLGFNARIVGRDGPVLLPNVAAVTTFEQPVGNALRLRAAGVEATISGPRVRSYKLADVMMTDGSVATGFAADGLVDAPLATVPTSLDLFKYDADVRFDVVGAVPTLNGPRLQVSLGRTVDGEPLAAVTDILPAGRSATNAIVRLFEVDHAASGRRELVVLTDEGVDVFCIDPTLPADGARCAYLQP